MNSQELLLKAIRSKLHVSNSMNDEIASVLNISYDAAHRRVSGKSKFSIEETVMLANHFNISLDSLFSNKENVIIQKTIEIKSLKDMLNYFKNSAENIAELTSSPDAVLYYSAKDIPLFYFMEGTIMSKFKAFVWLSMLQQDQEKESFEHFVIDESFMEHMQKLKKIYENVKVIEIWNDTTINSSIQQVSYFYESGLLSFKTAIAIYDDLKRILTVVKNKSNKTDSSYSFYYNELILLNNNMLIKCEAKVTMFIPYTLLGYFITQHKESCENVHQFFNMQIVNSKLLNHSGTRDQNLFFNSAARKIDYYKEKLNSQLDLSF
ncbi:helix-turn-helix domain-containing protein [Flavobacterium sp.]|uniref:helix-turn-helix domain-containing protein n=1 Tax=Flavobacterium sp. TaxID=239 RepID=UPI0024872186|nr:helix-turn-helix domain-containing protein [Flavobacterium sp.]MDI1318232.1 helix-turn-helix domain-containing protein [Flavobacterium sp.]